MFLKLTVTSARRLKQLGKIMHPSLLENTSISGLQPFSAMMNGANGFQNILQTTFSDIDANLTTSEAKCKDFIVHYNSLPQEQKGIFLCELAKDFGTEKDSMLSVANNIILAKERGEANLLAMSDRLRSALRPKYKSLFTHIGRVDGGVKFLVDLRADVLNLQQNCPHELDAALYQELNSALRELLVLWFTVGFLNLERITWTSPCDLVQKVSNYEAVHKIRTWEDIKRRSIIMNSRFRPSLTSPDTYSDYSSLDAPPQSVTPFTPSSPSPASFTILSSMYANEEKEDPSQILCAVFYSITSTQRGLQSIDLGNHLIKSVVRRLQEEFPHLNQFSSLSPIPGFRDWLLSTTNHYIKMRNAGEEHSAPLLLQEELSNIAPYQLAGQNSPLDTFKDIIYTNKWYKNQALTQIMMGPLMRLCAHYLYVQKRRNYALNPVANFHLSNGAVLWRINFLADESPRGLAQSCSLMVNYRYYLESTEENSCKYLESYQIQASPAVLNLLQGQSSKWYTE